MKRIEISKNSRKNISNGKNSFRSVFATVLAFVVAIGAMISANTQEVNAASVCQMISGSADGAYVEFTVKTNNKWTGKYVTLTQNKGTISYTECKKWCQGRKTSYTKSYGIYRITVTDTKTKKKLYNNVKWDSKSKKLSLKKNATYRISVEPVYTWYSYPVYKKGIASGSYSWKDISFWEIKATKNITLCKEKTW